MENKKVDDIKNFADKHPIIVVVCLWTILILIIKAILGSYSGSSMTTKCYWCGCTEECYQYTLQKIGGTNPNGSYNYSYDIEYMSKNCASEAKSSGRYINVKKN